MSKTQKQRQEEAIFMYGFIHELVTGVIKPGYLSRRVKELSKIKYMHPVTGKLKSFSESTIYRYLKHYRCGGIEKLGRKPRRDKGILKVFRYIFASRVNFLINYG